MKGTFTLLLLIIGTLAFAQPNSDTFPDFTETDINGVEHNLYDYLDEGKTVIVDVFATWCSICVASLPALHQIEDQYGEDLVFLSFERDGNTSNEAQWAANNDVINPVFDNSLSTISTWNIFGQPNFFVICTDGSYELKTGGVSATNPVLMDHVETCQGQVNSVSNNEALRFQVLGNPVREELTLEGNLVGAYFEVIGLTGQVYLEGQLQNDRNQIVVSDLTEGFYFVRIKIQDQEVVKRFVKT